jgi:hypothetical protein
MWKFRRRPIRRTGLILTVAAACAAGAADATVASAASVAPLCPAGTQVSFRWHYSVNGSSGSWRGTASVTCPGTVTSGQQGTQGYSKVTPGSTLSVGYASAVQGNSSPFLMTVSNAVAVFGVRCASGAAPSADTLVVPIPDQSYVMTGGSWYPSGDQHSALVYQGSTAVPDLCAGGQVMLDKGGSFSAQAGYSLFLAT